MDPASSRRCSSRVRSIQPTRSECRCIWIEHAPNETLRVVIDHAIEVPVPDAACRERLLRLYGGALVIAQEALETLVVRTEGVSAAFRKSRADLRSNRCPNATD